MPRTLRFEYVGEVYHVNNRGNCCSRTFEKGAPKTRIRNVLLTPDPLHESGDDEAEAFRAKRVQMTRPGSTPVMMEIDRRSSSQRSPVKRP